MIPALALALGCGGPGTPPELDVRLVDGGIEVRADRPLGAVRVREADGGVVVNQPVAGGTWLVPLRPDPGATWTVEAAGTVAQVAAPPGALGLRLEAPRGQGGREVHDGETVEALALGAGTAALVLTARQAPVQATVRWGGTVEPVALAVVGQQAVVEGPLADGTVEVEVDGTVQRIGLAVERLDPSAARARVEVLGERFPADATGAPDRTRPADRLTLPPDALHAALVALGVGRARDDQAPWAHQALTLANRGAQPLDVLVENVVVGEGAEAFAPRVRDATGLDRLVAAVRLPPGEPVTVALPLFVDRRALQGQAWTRRWRVVPLGATEPLHVVDAPLHLRRSRGLVWGGLAVALLASALGWVGLLGPGRRWLRAQPTSDLMTVALFGALSYVVAGVLQVVGHGVAAVLGPFAPLLTGLPDDALRACLMATLLTLMPRPGVAALATVTGALLRGLTLGSFHPVDLLYVGSVAFWHEAALYAVGLTRSGAWRDAPRSARWLRLSLGLGLANVAAVASGLCVAAALYRLYYATWYVALLLAVPGFLYVVLGCRVAVDLAASLRKVAS